MTKPDFAELKEKLTTFDEQAVSQYIGRHLDKFGDEPTYGEVAQSVHFRNVEIITELIEIIQIQSEAANEIKYQCARTYNTTDADEVSKLENVFPLSLVLRSLSETNTRLQKLREGKNG